MKSFAFVLLCVIAAVQGRSAGVQVANNQRAVAALGESPWVVHLRLARSTSGFLDTCAGSLIDASWLLTSAECVQDARFIWARFAAVEVIRPELVLETSAVRLHPQWSREVNNIAVVAVNRVIENTDNIAVIALPAQDEDVDVTATGNLCAYGENDDRTPGDYLRCYDVQIIDFDDQALVAGVDLSVSRFDSGAALVEGDVQIGIVATAGDTEGTAVFTRVSHHIDWIENQTGIGLRRNAPKAPEAPEGVIVVDN